MIPYRGILFGLTAVPGLPPVEPDTAILGRLTEGDEPTVADELVAGLTEFADALERGDLSGYTVTRWDGTE